MQWALRLYGCAPAAAISTIFQSYSSLPGLLASTMPITSQPEPYSWLMVIVLFIVIFFYGLVAMVFLRCKVSGLLPEAERPSCRSV